MNEDLAASVESVRFEPVRLREGYDMGEVDRFLDELAAALKAGQPVADLVAGAHFTPVRMREGYAMDQVDQFLDDVVARAAGAVSPAPAPAASPVTQTLPAAEVPPASEPTPVAVQEQRGLLSRLFGRRS